MYINWWCILFWNSLKIKAYFKSYSMMKPARTVRLHKHSILDWNSLHLDSKQRCATLGLVLFCEKSIAKIMEDDKFKAALYLKTGIMFVLVHLKTRIFPKYWNLHKNVTFLPSVTITCLSLIMFLGCCKLSFKLTSSNIFVCGSVHTGCLLS